MYALREGNQLMLSILPYSGKFSWGPIFMEISLQSFHGLIFVDASNHANYTLYNRTYFTGSFFADIRLSAKIGPHENFPLYSIILIIYV
jgi:hypothetical protein